MIAVPSSSPLIKASLECSVIYSVLTEAAIDVKAIDLSEVESAQARAEEALHLAEEEGADPTEGTLRD